MPFVFYVFRSTGRSGLVSLYPLYGCITPSANPSPVPLTPMPPAVPPPWRVVAASAAEKVASVAAGAEASVAPEAVAAELDPLLKSVLEQEAVPVRARK